MPQYSPFKFLAPYDAADKDAYWGREKEVQALYELLFATDLVLLYGPSGTGKTSLVQCGLRKKYNGPDWIPLFIRRGDDFNQSLLKALQKISSLGAEVPINEHILHIYRTYYRPVYLFFDQFEEAFTLAPKDEAGKITYNDEGKLSEIKDLFEVINGLVYKFPCKISFIMREEFIGQLYQYEPYLPQLFDFRLRVEPMNLNKIKQVLTGNFNHFNIKGEETINIEARIANNLLEGNATGQLAYLQVYLDQLWKAGYTSIYGEEEWDKSAIPPVVVTKNHFEDVGSIEDVLNKYLEQQETNIEREVGLPKGKEYVRAILDCFVTDDGTKRPILMANSHQILDSQKIFSNSQLTECLSKLENARLVQKDGKYYELAHDTLAAIIDKNRKGIRQEIRNLRQNIDSNRILGGKLDEVIIKQFDQLGEKYSLDFEDEIRHHVDISRKYHKNVKDVKRGLQTTVGIIAVVAIGVSFFLWKIYTDLEVEKDNLKKQKDETAIAVKNEKIANAQKKIADYNLMLKRIDGIVSSGHCPDRLMKDQLSEMERVITAEGYFGQDSIFKEAVKNTRNKIPKTCN